MLEPVTETVVESDNGATVDADEHSMTDSIAIQRETRESLHVFLADERPSIDSMVMNLSVLQRVKF